METVNTPRISFKIAPILRFSILVAVFISIFGYAYRSHGLQCHQVLSSQKQAKTVRIDKKLFNQLTRKLRATIGGKLATVWRSEWKTKLSVLDANLYTQNLIHQLLTPQTYSLVIKDLDVRDSKFVQYVHQRLYELQKQNLLDPNHDHIMVRDAPTPEGAEDSTFTYYSRPITDGESKHQVRVRTYLREIKPEQIPLNSKIEAFDNNGNLVVFERNQEHTINVTRTTNEGTQNQELSFSQFHQMFSNPVFFAPHGRSFKLEIKTALKDQIDSTHFPILAGDHMVQKLDVTLSPSQVMQLFKPLLSKTPETKTTEAINRVHQLKDQLLEKNSDVTKQSRVEAVMQVLLEGIKESPDFLTLLGATHYQRNAFESSVGFQTTVDSSQVVYEGVYNSTRGLLSPSGVTKFSKKYVPDETATRHVELKLPVNAVQALNGLRLHDPDSQILIPDAPKNLSIFSIAARIFSGFVTSVAHPGKFNFLQRYGTNSNEVNNEFDGD
jgi:hypothetical protein